MQLGGEGLRLRNDTWSPGWGRGAGVGGGCNWLCLRLDLAPVCTVSVEVRGQRQDSGVLTFLN